MFIYFSLLNLFNISYNYKIISDRENIRNQTTAVEIPAFEKIFNFHFEYFFINKVESDTHIHIGNIILYCLYSEKNYAIYVIGEYNTIS